MADNPYLALLDSDSAKALPEGMRRRVLNEGPQSDATEPVQTFDQFKGNWAAEAGRSIIANQANDYGTALPALVRGLAGDEQGMQRGFQQYERNAEEARQLGPQIQSFEDASKAGGGIGNYGAALGYEAANLAPTVLTAIATDGVGGLGTKLAVKGAVRRGIAHEIESDALVQAGRQALARRLGAEAAAKQEARAAARAASGGVIDEGAVAAAINTADAQATKQTRRAAMAEAARIAGRTPRYADLADTAGKWAGRASATLATAPQMLGQAAPDLAREEATQGDAALRAGGALAGAAFGLLPAERFVGMFGAKAAPGVAATADRFLVRLAKQTGGQAAAGGVGALGQTASALAAHAAVQRDPSILTNDAAWNQYVSSFGSGALLGGLMGGFGEGAKSSGKVVVKGAQTVRNLLRSGYEKVSARGAQLRERRAARFKPGDEVPLDEGAAKPTAANQFLDTLKRGIGAAKEKFDRFSSDIQHDEIADSVADTLAAQIEAGKPVEIPGRVRPSAEVPDWFKSPVQRQLMSYVSADSPLWHDQPTARRVARSLEKLFQERPDDADKTHLDNRDMQHFDALVQSGSMPRETLASMQMLGNIAAGGDKVAKALSEGVGKDERPDGPLAQQLREALQQRETDPHAAAADAVDRGADVSEVAASDTAPLGADINEVQGLPTDRPSDRVRSARRDVQTARERLAKAPNDDARAQAQADLDGAVERGTTASKELRKTLLGEVTPARKFGTNVFDVADNKAGGERLQRELKNPGRVEIQSVTRPGDKNPNVQLTYRLGLGLDAIVARKLSELSDMFPNTEQGQHELRRAATMEAFQDIKEAGLQIKPESITPGRIYTGKLEKGNRRLVGELTPNDVRRLRGEAAKPPVGDVGAPQAPARWVEGSEVPDNLDRTVPYGRRTRRNNASAYERQLQAKEARALGEHMQTRALGEGDFDLDPNDHALGPRPQPEGEVFPDGTFVPTTSPVTNVRFGKNGEVSVTEARARAAKHEAIDPKEAAREAAGERPYNPHPATPIAKDLHAAKLRQEIHDTMKRAGGDAGAEKFKDWTERRFGERHLDAMDADKLEQVLAATQDAAKGRVRSLGLKPEGKAAEATRNRPDLPRAKDKPLKAERAPKPAKPAPLLKKVKAHVKPEGETVRADVKAFKKAGGKIEKLPPADAQLDEIAGEAAAAGAEGAPDLAKENELVGALLKAAGISRRLVVDSDGAMDRKVGGSYSKARSRVGINDNLRGPERMETLLHEVGHHFFWNEIAKHVGWDVIDSSNMSLETGIAALKAGNPKLHDALMRDFEAFENAAGNSKPFHRTQGGGRSKQYDDPALAFHEWVADNVARALSRQKKPVGIVGEFFSNIATAFRRAWNMLSRTGRAEEFAAAKSVDDWVRKTFKDAEAKSPAVDVGVRRGKDYRPENDPTAFDPSGDPEAFKKWISTTLPVEARKILDRVLARPELVQRMRAVAGKITDVATRDSLLASLDDAGAGLENKIATAYTLWSIGELRDAKGADLLFGHGDNVRELANLSGDGAYAQRVFSDIANGSIDRIVRAGNKYDVRKLEARRRGTLQAAVNQVSKAFDKATEPLSVAFSSGLSRLHDSGVPELRKFAALIHRPFGSTGEDDGYTPAVTHRTAIFERKAASFFNGLTERQARTAMDMLIRQMTPDHPKWASKPEAARKAVERMRGMYAQAFKYAKDAGVTIHSRGDTFHPVMFDFNNPGVRDTLTKLYSQPKFEARIRKLFGYKDSKGRVRPSEEPIGDLIKNLVDGAVSDGIHDPMTGTNAPKFRAQNYRLSQFVYELGDAADIKAFASVQVRNPSEAIARYFEPLVKNAEYARRFGGGRLEAMIERMKEQGATPEQIGEAQNQLRAALGTYGADGSPILKALSPGLAERVKGPKTRKLIQAGQAYQNARLLPLSLLSSLVDPLGVAVRTGGDFKTAWDGFKSGMKSLVDKSTREELDQALQDLGATDDLLTVQNLYGGRGEGVARKVNDLVFKVNGMQKWVHTTRLMALKAAHGFMLKHADMANDTSTRYMQELKIQRGDIRTETVARPDGSTFQQVKLLTPEQRKALRGSQPEELARDTRVREALMRFVDEAILRPHSLQVPLWHNDPYMGLFTQYKTFAYAIYDQIAGRVGREVQHGNPKVLLAALSYVPIAAAAELVREFLQYGTKGNPQRAQWGPGEYAMLGAQKTGLLGPKYDVYSGVKGDLQQRSFPGSSQLGPTVGQASDVYDAFEGRRSVGNEIESAAPGAALYRHWDEGSEQPTQPRK